VKEYTYIHTHTHARVLEGKRGSNGRSKRRLNRMTSL